jgi:ATP-dependent Clp protease adapter protein ClpS
MCALAQVRYYGLFAASPPFTSNPDKAEYEFVTADDLSIKEVMEVWKRRYPDVEDAEFAVLLLNDETSSKEYVIKILQSVFGLNRIKSEVVMINASNNGCHIIGGYPQERAEELLLLLDGENEKAGRELKCISVKF